MFSSICCVIIAVSPSKDDPTNKWWDTKVEASLARLPERREAWEAALRSSKVVDRAGLAYLVEHLPLIDLKNLPPAELVENVSMANKARGEVPWGKNLLEVIFLDAVLPHASVTEPRQSSRREFHDKYLSLIAGCKTPGEAGLKINATLFKDYKVVYNTRRLRTDQSSKESIHQGMATCTGLSIMLVEACRSVGVPARLTGINSWPGRGGNHTWVEIWDGGNWHFVGAAEPDAKGLDHAWFVGDASTAIKSVPKNAIWAATYRKTGETFPLVWNPRAEVPAENVTDRYTKGVTNAPRQPRLMVEVRQGGKRVEAAVEALDRKTGLLKLSGKSLGPQADINLHLQTPAVAGDSFLVIARNDGFATCRAVTVNEDTVVRIDLDRPNADETREGIKQLLTLRFGKDEKQRELAAKLLAEIPVNEESRKLAREAYKASPLHETLRKEYDAKTVSTHDRTSPYLWRHVGTKPKKGWGLAIAMHGGGGTAKQFNDSQWQGMFTRYYKDHPEVTGYVYLALRAPNDTWNGFYDDAIGPLIERLIQQFVIFGDVDPDRVVTLGASHGGYGAFVIGTKVPDRFSAIHASASAPTDGETQGENLRNVHFTWMVGSKDTAYGRADRCKAFDKLFLGWRKDRGGYPGGFEWKEGVGHSVPDKDKLAEMFKIDPRNPWPDRMIWVQSDDVLKRFYWIEASKPVDKGRVEAIVKDNTIRIKAEGQGGLKLWLDAPLVDLSKPVTIEREGSKSIKVELKANLETYCLGIDQRGDARLSGPVRVDVPSN